MHVHQSIHVNVVDYMMITRSAYAEYVSASRSMWSFILYRPLIHVCIYIYHMICVYIYILQVTRTCLHIILRAHASGMFICNLSLLHEFEYAWDYTISSFGGSLACIYTPRAFLKLPTTCMIAGLACYI